MSPGLGGDAETGSRNDQVEQNRRVELEEEEKGEGRSATGGGG